MRFFRMCLVILYFVAVLNFCFSEQWIQTSDSDFAAGNMRNIIINGTGENAYISLAENTFSNKIPIIITNNTAEAMSDFNVKIILDASNFDFTKTKTSGGDIRFLSSDEKTPLYYWTHKWDSIESSAEIWVKIPHIDANASITIHLYFGSSTASSSSDIKNTFLYGNDFDDGYFGDLKIEQTGEGYNNVFVEGGKLNVFSDRSVVFLTPRIDLNTTNYAIESDILLDTAISRYPKYGFLLRYTSPSDMYFLQVVYGITASQVSFYYYLNGKSNYFNYKSFQGLAYDIMQSYEARIFGNTIKFYFDGSMKLSSTNDVLTKGTAGIFNDTGVANSSTILFDNLRIRKLYETDPEVSIGTAESLSDFKIIDSEGIFISQIFSSDNFMSYKKLIYESQTPNNTFIGFQFRTASSLNGLQNKSWMNNPDTNEYFSGSPITLPGILTGNYFQIKVIFKTSDIKTNLQLNKITTEYAYEDLIFENDIYWDEGDYYIKSLTLRKNARLSVAGGSRIYASDFIDLQDTGTIILESKNNNKMIDNEWLGEGVSIETKNITIGKNAKISADGQGYIACYRGPRTEGAGPGGGYYSGSNVGGAGGYGGNGGNGVTTDGFSFGQAAGGKSYGNFSIPIDLGSGSNGDLAYRSFGAGGGAIKIICHETLTLNGTISSNGNAGEGELYDYMGGGAGGSVYIISTKLNGSGKISANGGLGGPIGTGRGGVKFGGGGGAGGRIMLDIENIETTATVNADGAFAPFGGQGGTIYLSHNQAYPVDKGKCSVEGGECYYTNALKTDGMIYESTDMGFGWFLPENEFFTDTEKLVWTIRGIKDFGASVMIKLINEEGTQIVTEKTSAYYPYYMDTTKFKNGRYELRAYLKDSYNRELFEISRYILIMNNEYIFKKGILNQNETWTKDKIYIIEKDLTVPTNITLTIEPGTIIKCCKRVAINVSTSAGIINAYGTAEDPIIFTSIDDDSAGGDSNYNGNITIPVVGFWKGVVSINKGKFNTNEYTSQKYHTISHYGMISENQTWDKYALHYVSGSIILYTSTTLTINPGCIIKLDKDTYIQSYYNSFIKAEGTIKEPIIFTSYYDDSIVGDSNNDGETTVPKPGIWRSVNFNADSFGASFKNIRMYYGGGQLGSIVVLKNVKVDILNCLIQNSAFNGIYCDGGKINVSNAIINKTASSGIYITSSGQALIKNCTFYENKIGITGDSAGTAYIDVYNTIISESHQYGVYRNLGIPMNFYYSDVFNSKGNLNYSGLPDPTGSNGNISVNPKFQSVARNDFRLDYLSPCIDSADSLKAPEYDYMNFPRNDDPRSANTGIPSSVGLFADMGAIEFSESTPSDIDLIPSNIIGPGSVKSGQNVSISYKISNIGRSIALAPWRDDISLVCKTLTGEKEIYVGHIENTGSLPSGSDRNITANLMLPGLTDGLYNWRVSVNSLGEVYEGENVINNSLDSLTSVTVTMETISENKTGTGIIESADGGANKFYFVIKRNMNSNPFVINLSCSDPALRTELYVKIGSLPSPFEYDFRSNPNEAGNHSLQINTRIDGAYYVLVFIPKLPSISQAFTISVIELDELKIKSVSPAKCDSSSSSTLTIKGDNLSALTRIFLVAQDKTEYEIERKYFIDSSLIYAEYNMSLIPKGTYSIKTEDYMMVYNPASFVPLTHTLENCLQIGDFEKGRLSMSLMLPDMFRLGRPMGCILKYENTGYSDIPAPFIILKSKDAIITGNDDNLSFKASYQLLGISTSGPADRLRPLQTEYYTLYIRLFNPGEIQIINSDEIKNSPVNYIPTLDILNIDYTNNPSIITNIQTNVGSTSDEYKKKIRTRARESLQTHSLEKLLTQYIYESIPSDYKISKKSEKDLPVVALPEFEKIEKPNKLISAKDNNEGLDPKIQTYYGPDDPRNWDPDKANAYRLKLEGFAALWAMNPLSTISAGWGTYYAGKHVDHFVTGDGSDYVYEEDSWFGKKVKNDPGVSNYLNDSGSGIRMLINSYIATNAKNAELNKWNPLYGTTGVRADIGGSIAGIGLNLTKSYDAVFGIGKVNKMTVRYQNFEYLVVEEGGRKMLYYHGEVEVTLEDIYQWDDSYMTWEESNPNFWGWYLQHYGKAKPFKMIFNLGKFYIHGKLDLGAKSLYDPPLLPGLHPVLPEDEDTKIDYPVPTIGSADPNEKYKTGYGHYGAVAKDDYIYYSISFENLPTMLAPAQEVFVYDTLDSNLDLSTFELLNMTIGDRDTTFPLGLTANEGYINVSSDPNPLYIKAGLNSETREVSWLFRSIDPVTKSLPDDPWQGFLPPNDNTHRGEGFLRFRIKPIPNLTDKTFIYNQATIIFDPTYGANPPISTSTITNIIDSASPESSINELPENVPFPDFKVSWAGSDGLYGSGIKSYDIYYSRDRTPFVLWLKATGKTEEVFDGEYNHSY